ncbi:hypothetical protein [Bradyrhizobium sp. SZCCHNR3118]|uniref:hypothetical protein n=1 Tax=Bradyrhizobium sp. SZCCHNR3118 TaxID=3057468 RepID=UPI002916E4E0|nr:hypothetical protein [Bradyrhizobium sp. SZCCHNR3118]
MPVPHSLSTSLRHIPPGSGDYEASYYRHHVETGITTEGTQRFVSRTHFLEQLDVWNHDSRWKYWSKSR